MNSVSETEKRAIVLNDRDNVAVVLADCGKEDRIAVYSKEGTLIQRLSAATAAPRGHKVALADMAEGQEVVKYGEVIGMMSCPEGKGGFVHVHNMESCRGRGDHE